jgi:hypothetical protein
MLPYDIRYLACLPFKFAFYLVYIIGTGLCMMFAQLTNAIAGEEIIDFSSDDDFSAS